MRCITLPYGESTVEVNVPDHGVSVLTERQQPEALCSEGELLVRALHSPFGARRLVESMRPWQSVAILVSDITRPVPTARLLPPLLAELASAGISDRAIRIVFAVASHRCHTPRERTRLAGEDVAERFHCEDVDRGQFVDVGRTGRGTPVQLYRPVVEADWRIYTGNIEYHYFAGYTGGAKALVPGVSSHETISANHSWMVDAAAAAGRIEGNPVREDLEEAATFVGPAFLFNVVLDGERRIVRAVAGDVTEAHREGCRAVDALYRVPMSEPVDIVIASAGGWPKDINFYQAHKALENAAHAVKDTGAIILVAECREGIGHERFAEWLTCGDSPERLLGRIREEFVLGGHKAASLAKTSRRGVHIALVSAMDETLVASMGFSAYSTTQEAVDAVRAQQGSAATIAVIPHGGSVLPALA